MPAALAILLMSVTRSTPEFTTITGGPELIFPTAVFESQEPMITREAVDLLNRVLSVAFGISGPFFGFSGLRPREGPSGWPFGVVVSVECPMYTTIAPFVCSESSKSLTPVLGLMLYSILISTASHLPGPSGICVSSGALNQFDKILPAETLRYPASCGFHEGLINMQNDLTD